MTSNANPISDSAKVVTTSVKQFEAKELTQDEIATFVQHLKKNQHGKISLVELEKTLDDVAFQLQSEHHPHRLHSDDKIEERHEFLRAILGTDEVELSGDRLSSIVAGWRVPSLEQDQQKSNDELEYLSKTSRRRRLRALWKVHGPEYLFLCFVVTLEIAFGLWQCVKYATGAEYQAALGWGVGLSRACAGALWPTMFFVVLSMSRWYSTFMRRLYYVSRFINWDRGQSFHIKISIVGLFLATLHSIGHLSGSFVFGSQVNRQPAVEVLLGSDAIPKTYPDYIRSRPGWTGLVAIGLYWIIALMSSPWIRKRSYEGFQLSHLLMFPFIAMLMAHGTAQLLQFPVMGIILAFPTLLVIVERVVRVSNGFRRLSAKIDVLDDDTVRLICDLPSKRSWNYLPGQYVFLQVPRLSIFQWHPFTISSCWDNKIQLHIKTEYDWTGKLRELEGSQRVGIDGPFGAPAQRFDDYDQTMIVGAGIGVTPFSGILNDLQRRVDNQEHTGESEKSSGQPDAAAKQDVNYRLYKRADFHWIVRDTDHLLWFADLLNRVTSGKHSPNFDVRIHNHLTEKHKDVTLHIFRWLLEKHRTEHHMISPLTGLIAPTHFGRPHFPDIINEHYTQMSELFSRDKERKRRIGVFFCGSPGIGAQLADLCHQMTLRGREDQSFIEYHFHTEVF